MNTPLSLAIHAQEHAKTKKVVSNVLALNLVTQLYKMGAIEAARAPGTKKPADEVHFVSDTVEKNNSYIVFRSGSYS